VERNGKVIYQGQAAAQAKVRFIGAAVIFEDRDARLEGIFRVDQDRTPKRFDLTVTEGEMTATYPAEIYQLNGDLFRLCFAFPLGGATDIIPDESRLGLDPVHLPANPAGAPVDLRP
jgi:uncharacterized protein (TIGR03067 family)